MRDISVGISMLMLIINFFTFSLIYLKAKLEENSILIRKSGNYIISLLISLLATCIGIEINNNIIYIVLLLLNVSTYICVALYNVKWNHYELDFEKEMAEYLLRDCTNFTEEDFAKFTKDMSRTEQINWLKSLTCIDEETSEELHEDGTKTTITTEKIVPLIEDDEDLKEFDCFLKEDVVN